MLKRLLGLAVGGTALVAVLAGLAVRGYWGEPQGIGEVTAAARPAQQAQPGKSVVFGDLHAHTTYSFDAYSVSLPMYQGEGVHPPADACDYARYCSSLDFWSINDHAEGLTPQQWQQTRDMVRRCNAVAGDTENPDMVTYLGWEWTQIGNSPEDHYGHKNVVLLETDDDKVPQRPISSRRSLFPGGNDPYGALMRLFLIAGAPGGDRQAYHDFVRFLADRDDLTACPPAQHVRDLPANCQESASTPTELFKRLAQWETPNLVIPHGNTWGFYTPPLTSWDKQLRAHTDPQRDEFLIEVFSGHGNIEQYRSWRALEQGADGSLVCPPPVANYTAECWRAGEIIEQRCLAAGLAEGECAVRAATARERHVEAGVAGHLTVPGSSVADWLDAGQCRDCYMPAYNYRPANSVQYALALRQFDEAGAAKRFRFGMIGSSDVHTARPGTGYKELQRTRTTDAGLSMLGPPALLNDAEPVAESRPLADIPAPANYFERFASFFGTGGLVAAHSEGRSREAIWDALQRKEVYATSGDRILLWFNLQRAASSPLPMGSSVRQDTTPQFTVRALGAFEQLPGCPPDSVNALGEQRLQRLCGGECYHPGDVRKRIDRIEVVRIQPQNFAGEAVADLVQDPWLVLPCPAASEGCDVSFSDPEFSLQERDAVYYVRAIQAPSETINAGNVRCEDDAEGQCVKVNPCSGVAGEAALDDCLAPAAERAWSSPIFVDYAKPQSVAIEGLQQGKSG